MYNTWGPNWLEVGQKNSLSKKTSSKWSFLLTTFSYHPSLGSRHSQICHVVIVFKVTHCFPLILCFKMSYWEVIMNFKSLSYRHFPKMCCLPKCFLFIKDFIVMRIKVPCLVSLKPLKSRDQDGSKYVYYFYTCFHNGKDMFCQSWIKWKIIGCHKNKLVLRQSSC